MVLLAIVLFGLLAGLLTWLLEEDIRAHASEWTISPEWEEVGLGLWRRRR